MNYRKAAAVTGFVASTLWLRAIYDQEQTLNGIGRKKPAIVILGAIAASGAAAALAPRKMPWPVNGRISSKFGYRIHPVTGQTQVLHNGTDLAVPVGTPVIAPANGVVDAIWNNSGGGIQLRILHNDNKFITGYAHLSQYASGIYKGAKVKKGQVVALTGNTGSSTGPHLHLTLKDQKTKNYYDPEKHFK